MQHEAGTDEGRRVHTRQDVAAILKVPVSQVDAAIHRGELDVVRIGKHVRVTDAALDRFLGLAPAKAAA
jgi:excisionase family DNA binding protein